MSYLRRKILGALINPEYARLWAGQAVSTLGDAVFSTTLVLWVGTVLARGKPWAPAAVSGVLVAIGAAMLLFGPIAGVFADRWDSRRIALGTEVVRGTLVGLLTLVSFIPAPDLPIGVWLAAIYVVVFVLNITSQFFQPARYTLVRDFLPGDADRARASGIAQATGQLAMIIGPPLAAPLLFTVGVQWALLLNALSYAVSFAAIRSVPSRAPEAAPVGHAGKRPGVFPEFVAGLRFFGGNKTLVTLLLVAVMGQFGTAPLDTLNVFFVTRNLHSSAHQYGYLGAVFGVGGIIGALCGGRMVRWFGTRNVAWAGMLASGVLLAIYSRQTILPAGLVVMFLLALPEGIVNTAMAPLLLGAAPREYVGRVTAVFTPVNQIAGMLATVAAGWLLSSVLRNFSVSLAGVRLGPVDVIFLVSGGLLMLSGLYARIALRKATVSSPPVEEKRSDQPAPGVAGGAG
jgi:MFS family permease